MAPHRLRRSFKFNKRLLIDLVFAALSLSLIIGVSVLTLHRHPADKMLASAPSALSGSVTH